MAAITQVNYKGRNSLFAACCEGGNSSEGCARLLLDALIASIHGNGDGNGDGDNDKKTQLESILNTTDKDGYTIVNLCCCYGQDAALELLVGPSSVLRSGGGGTALASVDVNKPELNGYTPVHTAVYYCDEAGLTLKCLELLISAGADLSAHSTSYCQTPISLAVELSKPLACLEMLLAAGADCNTPDYNSATPIQSAFAKGDADIIRALEPFCARHI
jgi:ankyrin repeat protein